MSRPTLSLLIPAYNAAWCLPRLLTSARKQTVPFDEIWVYDDCSTDDTAAVAERYGAKVLRGNVNKGCSCGKNALARHVHTDWLHFHDADDELLPNFVEAAHSWTSQVAFDVIVCAFEYRDLYSGELLASYAADRDILEKDAVRYNIIHKIPNFCIYRRAEFLVSGGFDEDSRVLYNEDVASHLSMALNGLRFTSDNRLTCINYRTSSSMSSANALKCVVAHVEVMRKTLSHPKGAFYSNEIGGNLWRAAGLLAAHGDWLAVRETAQLAARLCAVPASAGKRWFRLTARLSPYIAIRFREAAVRLLKPQLRQQMLKR